VQVVGSSSAPQFEPQALNFDVGQEYILVVNNDSPYSVSFHYGEFGQKVATYSVSGSSSMSTQALVINGNSKLQWHFRPQASGEFAYYVSNNGLNARGAEANITVTGPKLIEKPKEEDTQAAVKIKQQSRFRANI
jgi:FtsP/CotA-like multicopper oxidase with cupredoxin domain